MTTTDEPRWRRASGRALFLGGLLVWARLSLQSLPYTYHDLHYLLTLDGGLNPVEWVHPLFVPALAALRWALALAGYAGPLLLPLELLNLGAAALTLCALFLAAERLCRDAVAAAAGVLWLGFSYGFWAGALRPDPYAFAAACATASLLLLLSPRPKPQALRFVLAGVAAGLAFGLHVAALALLPAGAAAAWAEAGFSRRGGRLLGGFALGLGAVAAASYALLIAYHGITPDYFRHNGAAHLFGAIQQMPGSSIYTSGGLREQGWGLIETLRRHGGAGLPLLLAAEAAALAWAGRARASAAALAGAAGFLFFFLINNSQNGFVYAAFLSAPLLLQAWRYAPEAWRRWAGPLTLAGMALGLPSAPLPDGPASDPLFSEARFLRGLLRPGDLMVMPGCPFPELMYERRFNAVQAGAFALPGGMCVAPVAEPRALDERLRYVLSRGRAVYFAAGPSAAGASTAADLSGAQKRAQPFAIRALAGADQAREVSAVRRGLEASFALDCGLRSPQGWAYCRVALRRGRPAPRGAPPGLTDAEVALTELLRQRDGDFLLGPQGRFLSAWHDETPEDPFVLRDLAALLPEARARPEAAARAAAFVEAGVAAYKAGRAAEAERAFREALRINPISISAGLSLGAVLDRAGRHDEALACYDRILALAPADGDVRADTLTARAHTLSSLGRADQARRDRRRALAAASPSWRWRKSVEEMLRARGGRS